MYTHTPERERERERGNWAKRGPFLATIRVWMAAPSKWMREGHDFWTAPTKFLDNQSIDPPGDSLFNPNRG